LGHPQFTPRAVAPLLLITRRQNTDKRFCFVRLLVGVRNSDLARGFIAAYNFTLKRIAENRRAFLRAERRREAEDCQTGEKRFLHDPQHDNAPASSSRICLSVSRSSQSLYPF